MKKKEEPSEIWTIKNEEEEEEEKKKKKKEKEDKEDGEGSDVGSDEEEYDNVLK